MDRIRAYILKLHAAGFHQVMGPYDIVEMKGFEGDVLLLERRAVSDQDRADVALMLKHLTTTKEPKWAVLTDAPKRE